MVAITAKNNVRSISTVKETENLARYELAHALGITIHPQTKQVLTYILDKPVRVDLNLDLLLPHVHSYLITQEKSFETYRDLHISVSQLVRQLAQTPCNLHFTPLVDGIYVGNMQQLYEKWHPRVRSKSPEKNCIGMKVANVTFLNEVVYFR